MEHKVLTREDFDNLWQQAEAEMHVRKLVEGYPAWKRKQRWIVSGCAICTLGIAVILPLQLQQPRTFDKVYCNRTAIADEHWVDVASEMLTLEMS